MEGPHTARARAFLLRSKEYYCETASATQLRALLQRLSSAHRALRDSDWPPPDWITRPVGTSGCSPRRSCGGGAAMEELLAMYDRLLSDLHSHYDKGAALLFQMRQRNIVSGAGADEQEAVVQRVLQEHLAAMIRDLALKQLTLEYWRHVAQGRVQLSPEVERTHAQAAVSSPFVSQLLSRQLSILSECAALGI